MNRAIPLETASKRTHVPRSAAVAVLAIGIVGAGAGALVAHQATRSGHNRATTVAVTSTGAGGTAPMLARGGEAEWIAFAADSTSPSSVAPADAHGGEAEAIASQVYVPAQAASVRPLTVYVVATQADQDRLSAQLDSGSLDVAGGPTGVAPVMVVAPGDDAALASLPDQFPGTTVRVVDLRQTP
jgi:hypothetical protein